VLAGDQSRIRIVYAERDVKLWRAQLPTVDEVRPGRCLACEAPSRPAGGNLGLHGHGLRERDQWGPVELGDASAVVGLLARRYRCQSCGAVIVVLPRGVVRRRLYSAGAIAIALALWAVTGLAPAAVRARVSPHRIVGPTAASGWASLRRWSRAVRAERLFPVVRALPAGATLRQVAARAATTLAAFAPVAGGLSVESAAFLGARM
jgi:transposase